MTMDRLVVAALTACILGGCTAANRAAGLRIAAGKDFEKGDAAACEKKAREALTLYAGIWPEPKRKDFMALTDFGVSYHALAQCEKSLGRTAEASADYQRAVERLNLACNSARDVFEKIDAPLYCRLAADDAELLAKWKKEQIK
jgi:hypothetical protein